MINRCVYIHKRKDTGEVFYVGFGVISRPYRDIDRNKYWHNIVAKCGYDVDILFFNLTRKEAIAKEIELIAYYGRKDLGKGTLVNMTDGGEGGMGCICTDENRAKKKLAPGYWIGKTRSEEACENMSLAKLGTKRSERTKSKIRLSMKIKYKDGIPHIPTKAIVCINTGVAYKSVTEAAKSLGLFKTNICGVLKGKKEAVGHKKYKGGLKFSYINN